MSDSLDLAALTRPGDVIAWNGASGEPIRLLELLNAQMDRVEAAALFTNLSLTETLDPRRIAARGIRVQGLGGSGTNRRFGAAGVLDVVPVHYGAIPDLVAQGHIRIDVALVQVAADGGAFHESPALDYMADAISRARVVIVEVNDQAPFLYGDAAIAAGDIDHVLHVSHPVVEARAQPISETMREIARHVARLVEDGATLQMGIGALPDAVLARLTDRRDLGLHSGTLGDSAAELVDAGVVTNRRKPIDTGLTVTAGLLGTKRLYAWGHKNAGLVLKSPRYTHSTAVHAQIPKLIGVNSALEVDLTGQINAEVAGDRHVGLVGGQVDFMRGCMLSPGGRGVVALEATARGGTLSRIVPKLAAGVVTTARSDADIVITEYGIAELRGRSLPERARALTAIAHPDFRRRLEEASDNLL
jgi:acyl-CoA hydrolase